MSIYHHKYIKYKEKYLNLKKQKGFGKEDFEKKLAKEYARYKVVQKLLKLERNPKYWISLERLMIMMGNHEVEDRKDEVFVELSPNHPHYSVILELPQFGFISHNEAVQLAENINKKIKKFLDKKEHKPPAKWGNDGYTYFCDDYKITVNKNRIDALRRVVMPEYKDKVDLLILIALLRYECIVSKWQQWGMPIEWYQYLYNKENVRMEGFTSPFYSQLMLLGSDTKFCSLFYDTDKYFGSLGNVFNVDFNTISKKQNKNMGIVFVPAFSYYLVKKAMKLILKWSNITTNLTYFLVAFNMPQAYEYSRYYRELMLSKKNLFYRRLTEKQWHFENNMITDKKVKFYWGKEMYIYVLGNKKSNYYPMLKTLLDNKEVDDKYLELEKILEKEYARYKYVQQILKLSDNYEWKNIIERFLNSMANIEIDKREDQIFVELKESHYVYQKMKNEIKEKNIKGDLVGNIKNIIKSFLKTKEYKKIIKYGQYENTYYCDDFNEKIDKIRELALIKRSSVYGMSPYYVILILIVMIRYACISSGGQNWNWPFKWYDYIYSKYDVILEGFSGPLNTQLLLLGDNIDYCSLFPDTDYVFGSKGSLFNFDISKYIKEKNIKRLSVSLNPPYIEHLMSEMVDLINKWFAIVPELRIFTGLPYWKDADALKRLENHKYLKFKQVLGPDEYYYENSMSEMVPKIYHKSKLEIFVLANFKKDKSEPDYNTIINRFNPPIILDEDK